MVPVRKFSMTTSASFTSRLTTSTASGLFRSSAIPRLFRLKSRYAAASPSLWGGQVRDSSPGPVSSTLMTSAPRSPRSAPHQGPAMTRERSMTRMPSSERAGLVMARTIPPLAVYIHPSANPSSGGRTMELYDVMRTTFSAREFTADPLPDEILFKILDRARFAPSGGNRQGWRVKVVASMDSELKRVGVISGASIYPFAWNILLAARHEGFAGTITTLATAQEPALQRLLGLPAHVAVAAVMPLGRPVKAITKLTRKPVGEFAMLERWGGPPLGPEG